MNATDPRTRLYEIAEGQSGYFTATQALEAGYSRASQHYHGKAGNWLRAGHGVYRLTRFPRMPNEQYVRLMLWSRDRSNNIQAVVSHETALQAYELSDVMPASIHLSVPPGFRKQAPDGVVLHQQNLPASHIKVRDGYRITTPLRTLLDVAASDLSSEHLQAALNDALEQGLVRHKVLAQAISGAPREVMARFASIGYA